MTTLPTPEQALANLLWATTQCGCISRAGTICPTCRARESRIAELRGVIADATTATETTAHG